MFQFMHQNQIQKRFSGFGRFSEPRKSLVNIYYGNYYGFVDVSEGFPKP